MAMFASYRGGVEVPEWRRGAIFVDGADIPDTLILSLTKNGAKKIG